MKSIKVAVGVGMWYFRGTDSGIGQIISVNVKK